MVTRFVASHITRSASAPGAIVPLRGYRPNNRAGLLAVRRTNSHGSMRPFATPSDAADLELGRERNDAGGASRQRGGAAGDEGFLIRAAILAQLLDMAVRVHTAGHHQHSVGVQRARALQSEPDRLDPALRDPDVRAKHMALIALVVGSLR